MSTQMIFPGLPQESRAAVLQRLLTLPGMILTFKSFFGHIKILEPISMGLRAILPCLPGHSLRRSVMRSLSALPTEELLHGLSRTGFGPGPSNDHTHKYAQLCLFLLRGVTAQVGAQARKARAARLARKREGKEMISSPQLDIMPGWAWRQYVQLASDLGFRSDAIETLSKREWEAAEYYAFLQVQLSNELSSVGGDLVERMVRQHCEGIAHLLRAQSSVPRSAQYTTNYGGVQQEKRLSWPDGPSREGDREYLYVQNIYTTPVEDEQRSLLTSFAVKRLIFLAFFGTTVDEEPSFTDDHSNEPAPVFHTEYSQDVPMGGATQTEAVPLSKPLPGKHGIVSAEDAFAIIKQHSENFTNENVVGFIQLTNMRVEISDNTPESTVEKAKEIVSNQKKQQHFFSVKDSMVKFSTIEAIFTRVNEKDTDYPRLIFYLPSSPPYKSKNFHDLCKELHGDTNVFKRTTARSESTL